MAENYRPAAMPAERIGTSSPAQADEQSTAEVAKDQAAELSHSGAEAGKHVADVAREQASGVAAEAGRQGKDLLRQAQGQLQDQAAEGQQRLASRLFALSDELSAMADAPGPSGMTVGLARQAASTVRDAGQWLDARNPSQVAAEVQSFARRRPAVFVVLAAGAGLVAGRLTRGLKDADSDNTPEAAGVPAPGSGLPDSGLPGSGLPATGRGPAWDEPQSRSGQSSLVTDDQASHQGAL
jgi:ribosomal protein S16